MEDFNDKAERKKWISQTVQNMIQEKVEADKLFPDPAAGVEVQKEGLWATVLRIRRNKSAGPWEGRKGITLVTTHAIGFHKEVSVYHTISSLLETLIEYGNRLCQTWEPVFKNLIEITETSSSAIRIEELWSLEAVNHGDAGLLNRSYIPKLSVFYIAFSIR